MKKFVFATNYNEGEDFLSLYIDNFLHFTDENCELVINLSPGRHLVDPALKSEGRIHIINGETHRSKWGMGLALGHLESFIYASRYIENFDYFCTMASNVLFFREFDQNAVLERLRTGHIFPETDGRDYRADHEVPVSGFEGSEGSWAWTGFNQSTHFRQCLAEICKIDRCSVTQIEGFVASKQDWDIILNYEPQIRLLKEALAMDPEDPRNYMAVEEMIFSTFVLQHGSGRFTNLCFMFWRGLRHVGAQELLSDLPALPPYLCCAKWFNRSITDPGAFLVGTKIGRELIEACREAPAMRSMILAQTRKSLDALGTVSLEEKSIAQHWGELPGWSGHLSVNKNIVLTRQHENLIDNLDNPLSQFAPFFLAEMTNLPFELAIDLADSAGELRVALTGSFPLQKNSTALAGYLYCSFRRPISEFILFFDTREGADRIRDKVVIYDNQHHYQLVSPISISQSNGGFRMHYRLQDDKKNRKMSIGIACYGRLFTTTRITVL